jgi:hypothetical protein
MPNSLRPQVGQPGLDRQQLRGLQLLLINQLRELEQG